MILPDAEPRVSAALQWLRHSIAATGGRGSAHSYSPLFGWARAYPETTGYLLETLYDYADRRGDPALRAAARGCAAWLCTVQLPEGAFPGLLAGSTRPSVFNTAQILFGLTRTVFDARHDDPALAEACRTSIRRALTWLLVTREPDGRWLRAAYVPGFEPTYYTRAVWGMLYANTLEKNEAVATACSQALDRYAERFTTRHTVADWGFQPGVPAFTHTIAYTLEGFYESAHLLGHREVIGRTLEVAGALLRARHRAGGRTAGRYDPEWRGDHRFLCVTGNAQLAGLFARFGRATGAPEFTAAAGEMLREILPAQCLRGGPGRYGAWPGSWPVWGPYLRFRYPNWAAKFFLDAVAGS